jgi:Zn ribbon nucleic-acid-binding protein
MFKIICGNCGYEDIIDKFFIRCDVTNLTDKEEETTVKTVTIECVMCGFHYHRENQDTHIRG